MPISKLDTDQRHAATSTANETAIVAGAGSGKTRLLVARYLTLIKRDQVPLQSIAAITFTNKAADQMKARIAQEARDLITGDPAYADRWREVSANAHRAAISTIHAFCSAILRRFPLEAGIDPSFTIIDHTADVMLRNQSIDEEIEELLAAGGTVAGDLIRLFGLGLLKRMLYEMLGMRPKVLAFLDAVDHGHVPDGAVMQALYERHIANRLNNAIRLLEEFHAFRPEGDNITLAFDLLYDALKTTRDGVSSGTVDPAILEHAVQILSLRGGSKKKWGEERIAKVRAALKETRELIGSIAAYYRREREVTASAAAHILELFVRVNERYRRAKQERGVLDHDDLLIESWRLLRSNYTVLRTVSNSFKHVMVDEFQDTDSMQMDIVRMISGDSSASLFTVGDPKQSIYRFRGADVTVFDDFVQGIESFRKLSVNYRSAPGILAFVNEVFGRIMGDEPQTAYDTIYYPMKPFRQSNPVQPAAEIMVAEGSSGRSSRRIEAASIIARIRELTDPDTGPGYAYGDMVILLRTSTPLLVYEKALLSAGIPFVNRIGGKLAGSPEAYDIGNLIGWLLQPDDPVLLIGVLASPFFSLDGDELLLLKQNAGTAASMPEVLCAYARDTSEEQTQAVERVAHAAQVLTVLREKADRLTIRELLDHAFDLTGYTLIMGADPISGDRSLAVIDQIVNAAEQFECGGGSRYEFAALLRTGQPFTEETAQVETSGNAVSLMTIHGSKGLEFKVVFLADITGAGSRGGGAILFDEVLGPGFSTRDSRGGTESTYALNCARASDKLKERAESKRLFYVGCTRAEDLLVISGGPPAKSGVVDSMNWMSWLHDALGIPTDGSADGMVTDLFRYRWMTDLPEDRSLVNSENKGHLSEIEKAVVSVFDTPLPSAITEPPPSTMSVSELLSCIDIMTGDENTGDGMYEFYPDHTAGGGAEYGDLVHQILERVDFSSPDTWVDTGKEVYAAYENASRSYLDMLEKDLPRFAGSSVYAECITADRALREEPFVFLCNEVLVRGTIDLLIMNENVGPVLVDYKTGAPPSKGNPVLRRYLRQLAIYAFAVHRATGVLPSQMVLYFVSSGKSITVPCSETLIEETGVLIGQVLKAPVTS